MEDNLLENIRRFKHSGDVVFDMGDWTSSCILYFKTLFVVIDLIIYRRFGKTPKDHSERFRLLEKNFSDYYTTLDKLFPIYRSTYSLLISKEDCEEVKKNVERILEEQGI